MNIRPTKTEDIPALKTVLDRTGLFPSDMLPDMLSSFLSDADNEDIWLTCEVDGKAIGFCFAKPEPLTDGTWNMLAIAIHPDMQGSGAGSSITSELEARLHETGQRILIVDTSGTQDYALTREFYHKNGYSEAARIRDFWADGDDKVTFLKAL